MRHLLCVHVSLFARFSPSSLLSCPIAELLDAFSQYGKVSNAWVATERETGRSRGFGFVTYEEEAAFESALTNMSGTELDGRAIRVDRAGSKPSY